MGLLMMMDYRKKTIETVEQFDFLKDMVASIPDPTEAMEEDPKPTRRRTAKSAKQQQPQQEAVDTTQQPGQEET